MQFMTGLFGWDAILMAVAGLLVLSLTLAASLFVLPRWASVEKPRRRKRLERLDRVRLSRDRQAVLLRYDDTEYLIVTGTDDVLLERIGRKVEAPRIVSDAAPPVALRPRLTVPTAARRRA